MVELSTPLKLVKVTDTLRAVPLRPVSLLCVLVSALALRLTGIGTGLPVLLANDEEFLVGHSLAMSWNDLNPHVFVWGSLPFYVLRMVTWLGDSISTIVAGHLLSQGDYYLVARLLSASLGTATVLLVFVLGRLLMGWKAGLLGAALFAVSPFSVQVSHYATVDSSLVFWATMGLVGLALYLKGNERGLDLAGVAIGLAIATKYNAALLLLAIVAIGFHKEWRRAGPPSRAQRIGFNGVVLCALAACLCVIVLREQILGLVARWTLQGQLQPYYIQIFDKLLAALLAVALSGGILAMGVALNWWWAISVVRIITSKVILKPIALACGTAVMIMPFAILDFPNFVRGAMYPISKQVVGGAVGYTPGSPDYLAALADVPAPDPLYYLHVVMQEWGLLIGVGIVIGLWAFWRRSRPSFVAFAPLIAVVLLGSALGRYFGTRYIYHIWGLFAMVGGVGAAYLFQLLPRRPRGRSARTLLGIAFAAILLAFPARASIETAQYFSLTDTRTLAWEWIEQHVPRDSLILREWDTPEIERISSNYQVHYTGFPFEEASVAQWKARGVNLFVISDRRYYFYKRHTSEFQQVIHEYDTLKQEGTLLQFFQASPGRKGPTIYIYAMP